MMALRQAPYYWYECDNCEESSTEGGDYAAWSDHGQALDDAVNGDWWISEDGERQLCSRCAPKCAECKMTLGEDGGCEDCDIPAAPGVIPGQLELSVPTDVLTTALADPEGQQLVQDILDRKQNP